MGQKSGNLLVGWHNRRGKCVVLANPERLKGGCMSETCRLCKRGTWKMEEVIIRHLTCRGGEEQRPVTGLDTILTGLDTILAPSASTGGGPNNVYTSITS